VGKLLHKEDIVGEYSYCMLLLDFFFISFCKYRVRQRNGRL